MNLVRLISFSLSGRNKIGKYSISWLITLLLLPFFLSAQTPADSSEIISLKTEKRGSIFAGRPGKSLLMSLILPGTGQIYNKSYLRVPFVYAAVGGMGWVLVYNTQQYNCLNAAYKARIDGTPFVVPKHCHNGNIIATISDPNRLRLLRDQANADRQQAIVLFSLVWLANGIDAFVNAHLKQFDIDDDLSIEIGTKTFDDPVAPTRVGLYVSF